jgi:predicted Zn-dependent peptidase
MVYRINFPIILIFSLFLFSRFVFAQVSESEDIYNVKYFKLDNGLEVYLKPRHHSKNVSLRFAVKVGTKDFTCDVRETAHYLEHLIFTGTPEYSEQQLEEIFKEFGGVTNATTDSYETIYEVSVHSDFTLPALGLYHKMLTTSEFSDKNILLSKNIVYREGRGKPSTFKRWLYDNDFQKHGINKAYEQIFSLDEFCPSLSDLDSITRKTIIDAFEKYYVPNNMAVVAVGNFDTTVILDYIKATFGKLIYNDVNHRVVDHTPPNLQSQTVESTLLPLIDNEASVTFLFRTAGFESIDSFPLVILAEYLNDKMYNSLRIEHGLSYNPSTRRQESYQEGVLILSADVDVTDIDKTKNVMHDIVSEIRNNKINEQEFTRIKKYFLLLFDMGYESNDSFAGLYSSYWRDFEKNGVYVNFRDKIAAVTTTDIEKVISKYIVADKLIIAVDRPTITYVQLGWLITGIVIVVLLMLSFYYRNKLKYYYNTIRKRHAGTSGVNLQGN